MPEKYSFPPGPSSTSDVDPTAMHKSTLNHKKRYGNISYINLKGTHIVSLNTVESIREALMSDALMDRPRSFSQTYILTGDIAVQPYSDTWQRLRQVMLTGLSSMRDYTDTMIAAQNKEFGFLEARLNAFGDVAFDPRKIISSSVINTMIIGLIGSRFDYDHEIFKYIKKFDKNIHKLHGSTKANYILMRLPCLRHLCFGYGRNFGLTMEAIDSISEYLLHDLKRDRDWNKEGMVYTMLRIQKEDPSITDAMITAVLLDMHIGGILTISAALYSLVYQLLCHPEIQTKLQEEIDRVIGKEGCVKVADKERMPYTCAVLFELFRQCPVLPAAVVRSNEKDATICGYHLPANTVFVPNLFGANHDEDVWPDPWKFDPQRFLDHSGSLVAEDHAARRNLVTFGDGRRACPGQDIARSRIFLYAVKLFQKFEMYNDVVGSLSNGDPLQYTRDIILYPPVYTIKLRQRNQ